MSLLQQVQLLFEVKMNDVELLKPNSSTNQPRTEILLSRILKGEPIELDAGGEIIIDPLRSRTIVNALKSGNEEVIVAVIKDGNKYPDVFFTKDGTGYKITALKKAAYFGGAGGGRASDAGKTAFQESAQAVALGILVKLGRNLTVADLTPINIRKGMSLYRGPDSAEDVMSIFTDKMWAQSTVNIANEIRSKVRIAGMEFHRGSAWVKSLESKFNTLNKTNEGGKMFPEINKWNPSDIWLVKKGTPVPNANDLAELKADLQRAYEENTVIGVSLKLSPKDTQLKVFNLDTDYDDILNLSIKSLLLSKTNNLFSSKAGFIIYEGHNSSIMDMIQEGKPNEIEVRSFKAQADVNAEIKGKYAAGGKISFGPVNLVLRQLKLSELTHRNEIAQMLVKSNDKKKKYGKIIDTIIKMAAAINPTTAQDARNNMSKILPDLDFPKLTSKYQAVQLLYILKNTTAAKRRDFIQRTLQYASSRSELSSVFIKVW